MLLVKVSDKLQNADTECICKMFTHCVCFSTISDLAIQYKQLKQNLYDEHFYGFVWATQSS